MNILLLFNPYCLRSFVLEMNIPFEILRIKPITKPIPVMIYIMVKIFPSAVSGAKSGCPTVVKVTMLKYSASRTGKCSTS